MKYLLDTCVISELVNQRPNARVVEWLKQQDPDSLYLSFITVGEIKKGIAKRGGDARVAATAFVHKMKLVTRNVDDMAGMGVPIFNPFDE